MNMELKDKTFIVYGASSGIGEGLALELSKQNRVGTFSRRTFSKPNENILHCQGDVTKLADIREAASMFKAKWGHIDGFIYSVGVAQVTDFNNFKSEDAKNIMLTNFFGFLNCLEVWLPDFLERKTGLVGMVSALMVKRSLPHGAAYFATKAAQHVFFEGLRMDLQGQGVNFHEIRPGLVDTAMSRQMQVKTEKMWSSEKAAMHIISQIEKNKTDISFPLDLKLLTQSTSILPDRTYFKIIKAQMDKSFREIK
ncbi:MAG: SDR family NAD(P)-dependent oxidoreductase [Bdellovibrionaceae bacterium]|nr:SDR family NAD(P)-dependent oxidoreductase [Pseudobdellovibrionaceae bacterium]